MPNIKSAKKRLRQNERRRVHNQAVRSRIRTHRKKFFQALDEGDASSRDVAFRTYCSVLDKAVKLGLIKRNTAVRRKTRASNHLRAAAES